MSRLVSESGPVTNLRLWLAERRRWDDLRRLRPWRVDLHDVDVDESRERPGQLRIVRGFPE